LKNEEKIVLLYLIEVQLWFDFISKNAFQSKLCSCTATSKESPLKAKSLCGPFELKALSICPPDLKLANKIN